MLQKSLLNDLLASAIALGVSLPTPMIMFKDNPSAVFAGLASGIAAGTMRMVLVANWKKKSENTDSPEKLSHLPSQDESSQPVALEKQGKRHRRGKRPNRPVTSNGDAVTTWLKSRDIEVISYHQPQETDAIFERVARYLGNNYEILASLHQRIKRSLTTKTGFSYNLSENNQQEINICTQYGAMLHQTAMLSSYYYDSKNKIIRGKVNCRPDLNQFLNGGWFERFVYQQASKQLAQGGKVECLVNPHLKFPNGDRFELDLLFLVDNQPLWIECKSGNHYNECLPKYCQHREILSVDKARALLVGLELPDSQARDLTALWSITVVNERNFLEKIETGIKG